MTDDDALAARLAAVERAVTNGDAGPGGIDGIEDAAAINRRLSALESTVADLADRVAELEAATQSVRGYLGGVRAVNRDVERRADTALGKVETLEDALIDDPGLAVERLPGVDGREDAGIPEGRRGVDPTPSSLDTSGVEAAGDDAPDRTDESDGADEPDGTNESDRADRADGSDRADGIDDTFVDRLRDAL